MVTFLTLLCTGNSKKGEQIGINKKGIFSSATCCFPLFTRKVHFKTLVVNIGHVWILIIKHCRVADTISQGSVDIFITTAIF